MKKSGDAAQPDDLGKDPAQVGPRSAGQSGSSQRLSHTEDVSEERIEQRADTNQSWESAAVEGSEDAADDPQPHTLTSILGPRTCHPSRDRASAGSKIQRTSTLDQVTLAQSSGGADPHIRLW
jgi:hypothetical protein